jgi:hypothetical protein
LQAGQMLKIQRSSNGQVIFLLSGEMGEEEIVELDALIRSEGKECRIVLDLKEVTLVAREAIGFLERCEGDGVVLMNCATYVREWIARQRNKS